MTIADVSSNDGTSFVLCAALSSGVEKYQCHLGACTNTRKMRLLYARK